MYLRGYPSGGSFELIGFSCNMYQKSNFGAKLSEIEIEIPSLLPLENQKQFIVHCPFNCLEFPEGIVYGSVSYALESSICSTSIHSGACVANLRDPCRALVTISGPKKIFDAEFRNGIQSFGHGPSDLSLQISKDICLKDSLNEIPTKISFRSKDYQEIPN